MQKIFIYSLLLTLLLSFQEEVLAQEYADWTFGPIVNSISGPTTGVVGETYTFSTTTSSTSETPMSSVTLKVTTNAESNEDFSFIGSQLVADGLPSCTEVGCTITGEFTPASPGTYYIYASIDFYSSPENETVTFCHTHPDPLNIENTCFESNDKSITFVVEDPVEDPVEETNTVTNLPQTSNIPLKTFLLISSGLLLILLSSLVKYIDFPDLVEESRKRFERRFE